MPLFGLILPIIAGGAAVKAIKNKADVNPENAGNSVFDEISDNVQKSAISAGVLIAVTAVSAIFLLREFRK